MEVRLGVQLFHRTTRVVRPTLDGHAHYVRCLSILQEIEDAEGDLAGTEPKGELRIEVQGTLVRAFILPGLDNFMAKYPGIDLSISERDRWVDLVEEGVDCAIRWGELPDSDLIVRPLGQAERCTSASPGYLQAHGIPSEPGDLDAHRMVGLRSMTSGTIRPLHFTVDGQIESATPPTSVCVTGPESYRAATLRGLGLAQMPLFHVEEDLRAGRLVSVLPEFEVPRVPLSLLYPRSRQLSPRVRAFVDWTVAAFRDAEHV